jgi:SAM-dependent methyltransferase
MEVVHAEDDPRPRLYGELAEWWPLLSAPSAYAEEAGIYRDALEAIAPGRIRRVLELGSGGGNNASHLKGRYALTLSDLSPAMLEVSRRLNPECPHRLGDMRTLRLGETFDAVFVHDAVAYLTTEPGVRAAASTAFAHCRPGGVALFVPDDTTETFRETTSHGGHDGEGRSLRYLQWNYDEDPTDTEIVARYAILLRERDGAVRVVTDVHRLGLFPRATWIRALADAGLEPRTLPYRHSTFSPDAGRALYVGTRPG